MHAQVFVSGLAIDIFCTNEIVASKKGLDFRVIENGKKKLMSNSAAVLYFYITFLLYVV